MIEDIGPATVTRTVVPAQARASGGGFILYPRNMTQWRAQSTFQNVGNVNIRARWSYYVDFAVAVGYRGSATAEYHVRRLWLDETLIYDATTGFIDNTFGVTWDFYDGLQQAGDAAFAEDPQIVGEDENGAYDLSGIRYPNLMHIVIRNLDLELTGLRYPKVTAEIWGSTGQPTTAEEFINDAGSNDTFYAANFQANTLFTRSGYDLRAFDLTTLELDYEITGFFHRPPQSENFEDLGATSGMRSDMLLFIPWLNVIAYSTASNSVELYFKDARTGALLDFVGKQGGAISSSVGDNRVSLFVRFTAIFDPNSITTYCVTRPALRSRSLDVFRVDNGGAVTFIRSQDDVYFSGIAQICPGHARNTIFLLHANGDVTEYLVTNGTIRTIYTALSDYSGRGIYYDPYRARLVFNLRDTSGANLHLTVVYDCNEERVIRETQHGASFLWSTPANAAPNYDFADSSAGTFAPSRGTSSPGPVVNLSNGSVTALPEGVRGSIWDSRRRRFVGRSDGGMVIRYVVPYDPDERIPLAEWLKDVGERLGFQRASIVTENITDTIIGAIIVDDTNARRLLADVCAFYQINMIESGEGIRFTRRDDETALAPVATLSRDDFVGANELEGAFVTTRKRPDDLPERVQVWYLDRDADFTPVPFQTSRNRITTNNEVRLDLPLVIDKQDVAYYATSFLYEAWSIQLTYGFSLMPKHIRLEPGDAVTVIDDDYEDIARIQSVILNGDWSMSVSASSARDGLDLDFITDDTLRRRPSDSLRLGAPASFPIVYDGPMISPYFERENEAVKLLFIVSQANENSWPGGGVYRASGDNALTFVGNSSENPIWGRVIGRLRGHAPCATDTFNVLEVAMPEPSFSANVNLENSQNLTHLCAVGFGDRWELITFSAFEYVNGRGRFSGLVRGRLGTDRNVDNHTFNEVFVYFGSRFLASAIEAARAGEIFTYAARGFGQPLPQAERITHRFAAGTKRPYPPGDVRVTPSGDDLVLSWRRRDRIGHIIEGWRDDGEEPLPLSEENETYTLRVLDGAGEVVREWTVSNVTSVTYTSAEIAEDAFVFFDRVNIELFQVSARVGGGYLAEGAVNVTFEPA